MRTTNAAEGRCIYPAWRDPDGGWLIFDTKHDYFLLGLVDNEMTKDERAKEEDARIAELNQLIKEQIEQHEVLEQLHLFKQKADPWKRQPKKEQLLLPQQQLSLFTGT
jgi:type II secretory pathway component HofQ